MKMEVPSFNGNVTIEEFLDQTTKVERFFAYTETLEDKQVRLIAYKLKGGESAWWDRLQLTRNHQRRAQYVHGGE